MGSNANPLLPPRPVIDQRKYGLRYDLVDEHLVEGATLRATLFLGEHRVEFDFYWLPWQACEEAFRAVGFRSWKIEPYLVPPDSEQRHGAGFWDEYVALPSVVHITCQK